VSGLIDSESLRRAPVQPESRRPLTSEELAEQIREFQERGGRIEVLPSGISSERTWTISEREQIKRERRAGGGR